MNFKQAQLESFCKNPNPEIKCVILFGSNEGTIALLQKKCAEAVCGDVQDAFRYAALEMSEISKDGQEIYAEYYAQSLMGGRRAVVVKNADNNLAAVLKNLIPDAKSDNLLIVCSSSLNTKSSLITWAKDRADVIIVGCYDDREENIAESAAALLRAQGLTFDTAALQVLCSRLSPDRKVNQGEIEKLAMYLGERKNVTIADVKAAVSDVAGANYEDFCYYVAGGEVLKSCAMFERLLKEGEEPAVIIRQLTYHFNKLLGCAALLEQGKSVEDAVKSLRPPLMFYRKDAFKNQLKIWQRERLLGALSMLYDCERDCKTTNLPAEQIASYCVMRISGAARKLR
ncbi:MAG: DNA polymerase III subunit delta [Alphaproteobacteria bacterium]|nr:DNA polymerase III subunit delta [Alphaproteobacteria bacterium]MDY4689019.1 DNA polymerase III subunit delta [Alphaproteobacteria bacterium]